MCSRTAPGLRPIAVACAAFCLLPYFSHGQDITSNLVGHWRLNETSGSSAADSSGFGNNGTVLGTASWQTGLIGNGIFLNGATRVRTYGLMGGPSNITVAAWVNLSAADTGGAEVVSLGDNFIVRLDQGGTTAMAAIYNGSTWEQVSTSATLAGKGWHHIAAVFSDSSNYFRIYIDGAQVANTTKYNSIVYSGLGSNTYIGGHGNGSTTFDFTGKIDDVRIYSRALSPTDIAALYRDGWAIKKLLLVSAASSLSNQEILRRDQFMQWGYEVVTVRAASTQATYNTLLAEADVAYVTEVVGSSDVGYKLRATPVGVVNEEALLHDEFGISTNGGAPVAGTAVNITNNSHPITSEFATGLLTITGSSQPLVHTNTTRAAGMQILGQTSGIAALGVVDQGKTLANTYNGSNIAAGRRVVLPLGGNAFDFSALNSNGLLLVERAIDWASRRTVAHWTFDEGSGSTIADSTANGQDAAFSTGSPMWVSGVRKNALHFNGSTAASTVSSFDPPPSGTVALWFKPDGPPASTQRLFGLSDAWEIRYDPNGTLVFDVSIGAGPASATMFLEAGKWYHVAFTYNSNNGNYTYYVDGQLVGSGTQPFSDQAPGTLSIGTRTGSSERFEGALDDFRIYNYQLSASEVAELYGLVGHWKLNELSGTVAADSSVIGNSGSYIGGAAPGRAGPFPGAGALAAEVVGGSSHIGVAPIEIYNNITETITVAAWVYFDTAFANQTTQQYLFARGDTSTMRGFALIADRPGTNSIMFYVSNGAVTGAAVWMAPDIKAGEWHHIVATYDGSQLRLYADGQLKATSPYSTPLFPYTPSGIYLGITQDGRLFDARLYNRAISEAEIAAIYGQVGWWKLDDTYGSVALDSSGAENDATVSGGWAWSANGKIDEAAELDGASAMAATSADGTLESEDFTVSGWFRLDTSFNSASPNTIIIAERFKDNGSNMHVALAGADYPEAAVPSGALVVKLNGATGAYRYAWSSQTSWPAKSWIHFAVVSDAADGANSRVYIKGIDSTQNTYGTATLNSSNYTSAFRFGGGAAENLAGIRYFPGRLDDIRYYNRQASDAEVDRIYSSGLSGVRIIQWVEAR